MAVNGLHPFEKKRNQWQGMDTHEGTPNGRKLMDEMEGRVEDGWTKKGIEGTYMIAPALAGLGTGTRRSSGAAGLGCPVIGVPIAFCFGLGTLAYIAFATSRPGFVDHRPHG